MCYRANGQACVDLTKKAIDQSMAESVVSLQPEVVTLNKAITSTQALETLLSGLQCCSVRLGYNTYIMFIM